MCESNRNFRIYCRFVGVELTSLGWSGKWVLENKCEYGDRRFLRLTWMYYLSGYICTFIRANSLYYGGFSSLHKFSAHRNFNFDKTAKKNRKPEAQFLINWHFTLFHFVYWRIPGKQYYGWQFIINRRKHWNCLRWKLHPLELVWVSLSVFTVNIATPIPRLGVLISRVMTSAQNQKANMEEGKTIFVLNF